MFVTSAIYSDIADSFVFPHKTFKATQYDDERAMNAC